MNKEKKMKLGKRLGSLVLSMMMIAGLFMGTGQMTVRAEENQLVQVQNFTLEYLGNDQYKIAMPESLSGDETWVYYAITNQLDEAAKEFNLTVPELVVGEMSSSYNDPVGQVSCGDIEYVKKMGGDVFTTKNHTFTMVGLQAFNIMKAKKTKNSDGAIDYGMYSMGGLLCIPNEVGQTASNDMGDVEKNTITVTNGSTDMVQNKAAVGAVVTITANAAPAGKQFSKWEVVSGGVTLADAKSAKTTFTMPAGAVEVKAVYEDKKSEGGKVTTNTTVNDGAPTTMMTNSVTDLQDKVLTEEEKQAVANGANANIYLEVTDAGSNVSASDKEKVTAALGNNTLGMYLDISLWAQVGDNAAHKVTEPSGKISVSIKVPENLINTDATKTRTYKIVRVHNGEPSVIEGTYDATTGYFTFETDAFSTYALAYSDSSNVTAPKTGDTLPIFPIVVLGFGAIVCLAITSKKQKEVK